VVREHVQRHIYKSSVENGHNFTILALLTTAKLIKEKKTKLFQEWGRQCSEKCKLLEGQKLPQKYI
jgi:hypothetical protein